VLRSLSLASAERGPPPDPSNRFADDPRAAALGHALFFDTRLSANGSVSCASCHQPRKGFQDGRPRGQGLGTTPRRTMALVGAAWQTWLFWDGRKDSLWSQALGPIANPREQGLDRRAVARVVAEHYRGRYEAVFGPVRGVDRVFANVGKAIEAYERTLRLAPARFDEYVAGTTGALSAQEVEGLRLFIGEAHCINCHSGPFFTNGEFHNTGIPQSGNDLGRAAGIAELRADEFNCLGRFSDAPAGSCAVEFLPTASRRLRGAFKPASLRNVTRDAPYMHAGQFRTLDEVLRHYRSAPEARVGRSELHPLHLDDERLDALRAFLGTLESPVRAPPGYLRAPRPNVSR
jgi:cytochrome c peroxidase